jgi:putative transmembrane protein PGPGW
MSSPPRFTIPAAAQRQLLRTLDRLDVRLAAIDAEPSRASWPRLAAASLAGAALIAAGIPMLVLPGPGVLAILAGLSLLAGQFGWARRLLARLTSWLRQRLASLPAWQAAP